MTELMDRPSTNAFAEARKLCLRHQRRVRRLVTFLVVLLVLAGFITAAAFTVAMPCRVVGSDMQPTLAAGSLALVNTLHTSPARGEVIACTDAEGTLLLRRVIGLPGDVIDLRDNGDEEDTIYSLYINGELVKEDYIKAPMDTKGNIEYPYTVPENSYFVMGDNRNASSDSRRKSVGAIPKENLMGKVVFRLYPFSSIGFIK